MERTFKRYLWGANSSQLTSSVLWKGDDIYWWWDDDFISIPSKSFEDNVDTLSIKKGYNKRKDCNLALVLVPKNFYMPAGKHCVHFLRHVWRWKCWRISDESKIFSSIHLHSSVPSILHWFTTLKTSLEKIHISKLFRRITIMISRCSRFSWPFGFPFFFSVWHCAHQKFWNIWSMFVQLIYPLN